MEIYSINKHTLTHSGMHATCNPPPTLSCKHLHNFANISIQVCNYAHIQWTNTHTAIMHILKMNKDTFDLDICSGMCGM